MVEAADGVVIEVDDAESLAVFLKWGGDFAANFGAYGDIAWIGFYVGNELRASVKNHPAGDALTEAQADLVGLGREALLNLDFEFAGVGVEQGDRAAGGLERGDDFGKDRAESQARIFGTADE